MTANNQIKAIVERIEYVESQIADLNQDRKEIYQEAKGNGFDTKALRTIIRLRKQDADDRAEQEALIDIYKQALGMLSDTPLGQAAIKRAGPPTPRPAKSGFSMDEDEFAKEQALAASALAEHGLDDAASE